MAFSGFRSYTPVFVLIATTIYLLALAILHLLEVLVYNYIPKVFSLDI